MSLVEDYTTRLAQCLYLVRIDEIKMFENGHNDQRITLTNVNDRNISVTNRHALPQRCEIVYVALKYIIIDKGRSIGALNVICAPGANTQIIPPLDSGYRSILLYSTSYRRIVVHYLGHILLETSKREKIM
jgi:hypothetical protein